MSLKYSTALVNALAVTGSLRSNLSGAHLYLYAGTVPASADASIGAATLLCDVSGPAGAALEWSTVASNGALTKDPAQVWSGVNAATGTATFFRIALPADTGASSSTDIRVQGTVGTSGATLNLSSVSLTSGATQTLEFGSITTPLS